jgi:aldose 1-epimerase
MAFSVSIHHEQQLAAVTLQDDKGISAEIYSLGGLLNRFELPVKGRPFNLVWGFEGLAAAKEKIGNAFQSARLSPFVCRLRNGQYSWLGETYQVQKKFLGAHAIHGLMYDTPFEIISTHADEISASVRLKGSYDGSDPGYPFPYEVELEWVLREGASLSITSTLWHQNAFEIPMAEGWHPYFTLGGKSDDWVLQFNTNRRMEYDAELLPTGQLIKDDRFLHGMSLAGVHLDNGFVWSEDEPAFQRCVLSNQDIVLTLLPDKSFPVLQVFTPDDRNSVALENLSGAPDNFNNHLLLISLAPGMQHQFTTCYVAAEKSGT